MEHHYSIKDIEAISNVKAHTIRIWEQRYNLFTPGRSDTNIRFYTDEQLKRLLNIVTLMDMGMKISKASKLDNSELHQEIDKLLAASVTQDGFAESIINQAIIAISEYDLLRFDRLFNDSTQRLGVTQTYLSVIYPLLLRVGLMWNKDDVIPAQEHFLSNIIKQKLHAAIDQLPAPEKFTQTWVLFLGEGEKHEIGLLFANYILRQYGQNVIYLGQEVPYENLVQVVHRTNATHMYTFFVRKRPKEEIQSSLTRLCADFADRKICFSGSGQIIGATAGNTAACWIKDIQMLISNAQAPTYVC